MFWFWLTDLFRLHLTGIDGLNFIWFVLVGFGTARLVAACSWQHGADIHWASCYHPVNYIFAVTAIADNIWHGTWSLVSAEDPDHLMGWYRLTRISFDLVSVGAPSQRWQQHSLEQSSAISSLAVSFQRAYCLMCPWKVGHDRASDEAEALVTLHLLRASVGQNSHCHSGISSYEIKRMWNDAIASRGQVTRVPITLHIRPEKIDGRAVRLATWQMAAVQSSMLRANKYIAKMHFLIFSYISYTD